MLFRSQEQEASKTQRALQAIAEAQAQEQAKKEALYKKGIDLIQAQRDSNAGKAINAVDLNLGDSIAYTHLKPTRINLENKDYPAEFAIINKEDLKLNFNTTGTQGRTQKQEAINTALAKKSGAYTQESLVDEKDLAEIPLPQDLRWEVSALKSAKTDYSYIIKHKKLKNQDDELKKRIVRESIPIMQSFRTKIEQALNLHPTKDFGTNYAEYYRDGQGAITKRSEEHTSELQSR